MKKSNIKNRYAIWIDHQKAIVLCVDVEGKLTEEDLISPIGTRRDSKGKKPVKLLLFWSYGNKRNTSAT